MIIPEVVLIQLSSWRWAHSCSKHVEDLNKHIIEEIVRQVDYLPKCFEYIIVHHQEVFCTSSLQYFTVHINLLKPTCHGMHQQFNIQQLYALPAPYLCVFIWEQTATCATYSINWLVFITEMKSVYCAVRTGSLNTAVCSSSLKG